MSTISLPSPFASLFSLASNFSKIATSRDTKLIESRKCKRLCLQVMLATPTLLPRISVRVDPSVADVSGKWARGSLRGARTEVTSTHFHHVLQPRSRGTCHDGRCSIYASFANTTIRSLFVFSHAVNPFKTNVAFPPCSFLLDLLLTLRAVQCKRS